MKNESGQAALEYLLLLTFVFLLLTQVVGGFTGVFKNTFGNLAHVLSLNLSTGLCPQECFFSGYQNGR